MFNQDNPSTCMILTLAEDTERTFNVPGRPVIPILELELKAYLTFLFLFKPFFSKHPSSIGKY